MASMNLIFGLEPKTDQTFRACDQDDIVSAVTRHKRATFFSSHRPYYSIYPQNKIKISDQPQHFENQEGANKSN